MRKYLKPMKTVVSNTIKYSIINKYEVQALGLLKKLDMI